MLFAKILRSPHAHARVIDFDVKDAQGLPGVEAVLTCWDMPQLKFATAGHIFSLNPNYRDKEDRLILTDHARFVGDGVAVVVARNEFIAEKALALIKVNYEILEPLLTPEAALREGAPLIHQDCHGNILSSRGYEIGNPETAWEEADIRVEGEYRTSIVQHCQMENHIAIAYQDGDGRIVVITSTQIPHIVRRIVAQALDLPWGKIKVIKPYVGGGFGSKQDVCVEPLAAQLTLALGGRPVKVELSREECMIDTRTRHAFQFHIRSGVSWEGRLKAIDIEALSNTGAYASHGHSVASSAGGKLRFLYTSEALKYSPRTIFTNLPVAGAMRAYGSPQIFFAFESHMDDIARKLNMDPIEIRLKNFVDVGFVDPISKIKVRSCGIRDCVKKGSELVRWAEKRIKYQNQTGDRRRGVGMAAFSYQSGTYPVNLEIAGARIVLNQDGSVQLQLGAIEIGQGSDTVFAQMVAEILGLSLDGVHVISTQDTDISPFDAGAFASRQTYVSGMAVRKAALEVKEKVLEFVRKMTDIPVEMLELKDGYVVTKPEHEVVMKLRDAALQSYYDPLYAHPITSDTSHNARINAISYGVTFVEIEVDIKTGQIEILEIYNVHDSGKILNPQLGRGQVHGGVSMGIGYALSEQLLFHEKTGQTLNNNFLDYKLPTIVDTPEIGVAFVETEDPTGPFGAKSLGEPPTISPAPAIRNALLHATGVAFAEIPFTPQRVYEKLRSAGIIQQGGGDSHV